jgi:hypothetical protein
MMTPHVRDFHERCTQQSEPVVSQNVDGLPHPADEDYPIMEDGAFAQLVDTYFGPAPMDGDHGQDSTFDEWTDIEREARTPLFEGSESSRYV